MHVSTSPGLPQGNSLYLPGCMVFSPLRMARVVRNMYGQILMVFYCILCCSVYCFGLVVMCVLIYLLLHWHVILII